MANVQGDRKLVIVGAGEFGAMALEYFQRDSPYEVCGFAVERQYLPEGGRVHGLPVVDFTDMECTYPPASHDAFVAVTFVGMNDERQRLHEQCKAKGYTMARYQSAKSYIDSEATLHPGSFVMECCSIQRNAVVGEGTIVWCGCVIAHGTRVGDFAWIAPGVSSGGYSTIGSKCFVGVGASIGDQLTIPEGTLIGAGSVLTKSLSERESAFAGNPIRKLDQEVYMRFREG
jgi:sugar O-acyltransferase (sialic acid O-acetyltransferase NeuD family)